MRNTRDMIREFSLAFGRPIHDVLQMNLSVSDRLLLGKLLFEETLETIEKGLGLRLTVSNDHEYGPEFVENGVMYSVPVMDYPEGEAQAVGAPFILTHVEGDFYDPVETADGLGDTNVVIHFIAHWLGMDLDAITAEINDSNMSKLAADGTAIINGVTPGYRDKACLAENNIGEGWADDEEGFRADLPIGKILKGPNFRQPDIAGVIGYAPAVHIDESTIQPSAQLDHCADHPDQTTENCEGGYGLAGGGVGVYYICNTCGGIFGKTDDGEDF